MSLFDFFFPEVARATHLRRLTDSNSITNAKARMEKARSGRVDHSNRSRVVELEEEVAQLTNVVQALLEKLGEKEVATRLEITAKMAEIDARDGVIDGKITEEDDKSQYSSGPKLEFPE